jgi:twitching motility protein PilT
MSVKIDDLLVTATAHFASDLHLKAGSFPIMRIGGELYPVADAPKLSPEDTLDMAFSMMSNRQKQKLKEVSEVDIAYSVKGLGRFRANIFQQRGTVSIVLRVIPDQSKTSAALGLPAVIDRIAEERRGLILVTGATGSGKSTTLAAMIDRINTTRSGHIVTIEDPIEFLHRDKMAFVTQREVDVDTRSFAEALRGALRQDPDVILVGEMRDLETISTALTAAETGHLVLSTLHTLDATETIMRIVSSFPSHQQKSVRIQLAGILKAVISMRLVRAAKGSERVPAVEVMVSTALIRDYIVNEDKTSLIREAIANGASQYNMQTFDQSLFQLLQARQITYEEAIHNTTNADEFKMRVSGIFSTDQTTTENSSAMNFFEPPPEEFVRANCQPIGETPKAFINVSPGLRAPARYPGKRNHIKGSTLKGLVFPSKNRMGSRRGSDSRTLSEFAPCATNSVPRALPWAETSERLRR